MKKPTVLLTHYKVISWVYLGIIPELREQLNARFLIVLPFGNELPEGYKRVFNEHDKVIHVKRFEDLELSSQNELETFNRAKIIENKYECNLLEDVLLQERSIAQSAMQGATSKCTKRRKMVMNFYNAQACNYYFQFFEDLFDEYDIKLSLVWPRTSWEAVIGVISSKREILVTYPYTSKGDGNLVYWADGMFANSTELKRGYVNTRKSRVRVLKDLKAPGRPEQFVHKNLPSYFTFKKLSRRLMLIILNNFLFHLRDLSNMKRNRRKSLITQLLDEVGALIYWKRFNNLCLSVAEIELDKPFALFTFQNEPEFSVQGRCKEFYNQSSIILAIADAMPVGSTLYIKEHAWVGHRKLEYYKDILRHPNIVMLPPSVPASGLLSKAKFVASLNGTIIFEAALAGVPAAYFSERSEFSVLANSFCFTDMIALGRWVNKVMTNQISLDKLSSINSAKNYIEAVRGISFEGAPLYLNGDGEVPNEQIQKAFELLIQKIAIYKENKSLFGFKLV